MKTPLTTERLIIRHACYDDASSLLALLNQASFIKNIGDKHVHNLQDAIRFIDQAFIGAHQTQGFGPYVITLKNKQCIGVIGFYQRTMLQCPDLGFALLTAYEKQGYIAEAGNALIANKSCMGIAKLSAITAVDNSASKNVLLKLGFTPLGKAIIEQTTQRPVMLYVYGK